jgi:peroxiredoxin
MWRPAPEFTLLDDQGEEWKSADHYGQKIVVIYFYPADFTGGCTKQACSYRDDFSTLKDAGVEVIGISGDSVKNHAAFKKFHSLNFPLLADPEGEAAEKLGVPFTPGEKTVTFEIDGKQESFVRTPPHSGGRSSSTRRQDRDETRPEGGRDRSRQGSGGRAGVHRKAEGRDIGSA